jgi:SSS family solute:Na+ symporter
LLGATGFVIRKLRENQLMTVSEFFHKRFSKRTRILAGTFTAIAGILNMGVFPKMGAIFITYVTGLGASPNSEFTVNLIMSILIVMVVLYTITSGMVAVIILDFIQFTVLSIGLLIGLYFVLNNDATNWDSIIGSFSAAKGEAAFNPFHGESEGWIWVLFNFLAIFASGICWMPAVSRSLTAKDPKTAKRTFMLGSPGQFIRWAIPAFFAFGAFAYFTAHPELTHYFFPDGTSELSPHNTQAMPLFMGKLLPMGLLGILTAGLLAAFMSTHDSYFMSWAAVISRDIISPLRKAKPTEKQEIRWARISILLIGLFLLLWGLWYELPASVWKYMAITGTVYFAGASVSIIGGIYWKRTSTAGATAAILGGLLAVSGVFVNQLSDIWPWFSIQLIGVLTFAFSLVLLIVFSLAMPDKKKPELIIE